MAPNLGQQPSARHTPTHHLFNIFGKLRLMLVAGLLLLPQLLAAQWNATVGAESNDLGRQALAFLPNEIWIHAGDSITWTVEATEPHTVTFLTDGQIRPPFNVGCPGFFTGSAVFDGSSCVTSPLLFKDAKLHAQGITAMTSYGNSWLGDPVFAPVWNELNRRSGVVFVHPAIPACCASLGQGLPPSCLELPFDSARSAASLWFGGALEQYSRIRFVFSHGGGALPMVADRIDKFGRPGKEPGTRLHDAVTQFDKLYFDTANAANAAALAGLMATANPRHVLFGTDYPYVPLERGVDGLARADISLQQRRSIESDNALSLMPLLVP